MKRMLQRKTIEMLQHDATTHKLHRNLGPLNLISLGVGCILGAGIYVMLGNAAANYAGPAVVISLVIAATACCLTGLCYAELASAIPVGGSSYSYCYATLGEAGAWILGWLLLFEYSLAAAALSVGFSGYLVSLLGDFGIYFSQVFTTPTLQAVMGVDGIEFVANNTINFLAMLAIAAVTLILYIGSRHSATANNVMVFIKVSVLLIFVTAGVFAVDAQNWTPFIPENQGDFRFGWSGVLRASSILFFAYIGFEAVCTAAYEAKNPQRDLPIGILGALLVCTLLYMAVAYVLVGTVPYEELGVPDAIAVAADRMGQPVLATLIKLGALMGLGSVLLVNAFTQSRMGFTMSRDGLLPPLFSRTHKRFHTPHAATVLFGGISAIMAGLLPISLLGDLVSLGITMGFMIVCVALMWLRTMQPEIPRAFKVPFGGFRVGKIWVGYVPLAAFLLCIFMITPLLLDVVGQAMRGEILPASIIGVYILSGVIVYLNYGIHRSKLRQKSYADSIAALAQTRQ